MFWSAEVGVGEAAFLIPAGDLWINRACASIHLTSDSVDRIFCRMGARPSLNSKKCSRFYYE